MAVYKNRNPKSPIASVEFTPVGEGNFTFFYPRTPQQADEVKRWLSSADVQQETIAETKVNGHPVLITQGDKKRDELMALMARRGDKLTFYRKPTQFSEIAWPLRSALGVLGQSLQITSSVMRKKTDWHLFAFALANITANGVNVLFGAQKSPDTNRLRFLKEHINQDLAPYVPEGEHLPDVKEIQNTQNINPEDLPAKPGSLAYTLKHHSVTAGELGLRYFGAAALASDKKSNLRSGAGWGSISGKTIALFSKAPDRYDTKPHTWLDDLREKVTFRLGGLIEAASFATLAYDGFANQKITWKGRQHSDYLSGIGASMFTAAYIIRNWAPYGVKELDTEELYAHVANSLAVMPPDKLPQLIADTAAMVKEHRHDERIDFGRIYTRIAADLYRYHRIVMETHGNSAPVAANHNMAPAPEPRQAESQFTKQHQSRKAEQPAAPAAGHTEKLARSDTPPARMGL